MPGIAFAQVPSWCLGSCDASEELEMEPGAERPFAIRTAWRSAPNALTRNKERCRHLMDASKHLTWDDRKQVN
jgi:hypothetical protein